MLVCSYIHFQPQSSTRQWAWWTLGKAQDQCSHGVYFELALKLCCPLFPGSLLLELGHMRHLGLCLGCTDISFTGKALCWQEQHHSLCEDGSSIFLHKIHLKQKVHFSGCSPLHQGRSAELIQGGVKARAVFRVSHLLGNIKLQEEPASAKPSLCIPQQRLPAGPPCSAWLCMRPPKGSAPEDRPCQPRSVWAWHSLCPGTARYFGQLQGGIKSRGWRVA